MKLPILRTLTGVAVICGLAACSQVPEAVATEKSEYNVAQYDQAVAALEVEAPTNRRPLQMKAALIPASASPGDTVRLVVKVRLMPGWHFYDYVPPGEPYKQTEWMMEMGNGLQAAGDWSGPSASSYYANPMMMVHEGQAAPLVFYRELVIGDDAAGEMSVSAGIKFQVCDINMCLPVKKRMEELMLTVAM